MCGSYFPYSGSRRVHPSDGRKVPGNAGWSRNCTYHRAGSPGFDPEIVDYCLKKEIPVLPGCISPSEVAQAVKRGLKTVKFFPAEQAGGVAMIKAMAAPYTGIKFMPTGGINAKNLEDYLSFDKIICCGGSWMVKGDLVKAGAFDKIKELTAEARNLVESIRK